MSYEKLLNESGQNITGRAYKEAHCQALRFPHRTKEAPLLNMLRGWLAYADMHRARYESGIGEDGVLGDEWATIGRSLLELLNGETGRLDCGSLDEIIRKVLKAENVPPQADMDL